MRHTEREIERIEVPVLIVGAGAAGLRVAIELAGRSECLVVGKRKHGGVLLDISHEKAQKVRERLPKMVARFAELGIDITEEPIEVAPTAHYTMGGIKVDFASGQTGWPGSTSWTRRPPVCTAPTAWAGTRWLRRSSSAGASAHTCANTWPTCPALLLAATKSPPFSTIWQASNAREGATQRRR
jgi:hypothetical protein